MTRSGPGELGEAAREASGAPRSRLRRVMFNSSAAIAAKGVSFAVTLALFPVLIGYLGKAQFAVWLVATSLVQVLSWTDLGLGNATVTRIARRDLRPGAARETVACAYACMAVAFALLALALAVLWRFDLLGFLVPSRVSPAPDTRLLFAIGLSAFLLWLPTALAGSIETGLRMGAIASLCRAASNVASAGLTLWAVRSALPAGDLVAIACFTPVAFNLANTVLLFGLRRDLLPRVSDVSWPECRELLRLGGLFLGLQLGVLALSGADAIIVLRQAGPEQAVDYSAVAKLFGSLSILGATLFAPLWPEYGVAHARGEMAWVRRTFRRSLIVALAIGVFGGGALAVLSPLLIPLWLGHGVNPKPLLVALAATWLVIDLASQCVAMMLNGMAVVRPQVVTSLAFAALCLPLKWSLAARYGAAGVYVSTIACYAVAVGLPYSILLPRLMGRVT